ncbi:MAG TPA: tyrosine-type recombinase/integrase [Caldisericia bacterium]|jgi:integrase/recombinase XerC/integrase/recombinase XerD|nr:tyrosine-type recombinase/integrase [Caldisericia bacterium]
MQKTSTEDQLPVLQYDKDQLALLILRFISALDLKETSKYTYQRELKPFSEWVVKNRVKQPIRDDILQYKAFLEKQGLSPLTISSYIVVVRRFFEWMESEKIYPNIARGVKGMKRNRGFRKDPLTLNQIQKLLQHMERESYQGLRDFAIINLLIRTGLRTIELVRSNVGDIRQESGQSVLWVQGKGRDSKDEFVVLTDQTLLPIQEYLKKCRSKRLRETDPLFSSISDRNSGMRLTTRSISRIVKDNLRRIGIDNLRLTAHSLRHTAITLALQGGASLQEAQALGRHANINTTMIYAHNINRVSNAPEHKIDELLRLDLEEKKK